MNSRLDQAQFGKPVTGWRLRLYTIVFEADTRAGRWFDLALIWVIVSSILVVLLDSVASVHASYGLALTVLEWIFTGLFTVEYLLRLLCVQRP